MMGTILQLSSCNSSPPRVMDASATNLIIQTCKDLGSIKFSFVNKLYSVKSEFTCCSNNLACAPVIGPVRRSTRLIFHAHVGPARYLKKCVGTHYAKLVFSIQCD
jgi:hypothetical protein